MNAKSKAGLTLLFLSAFLLGSTGCSFFERISGSATAPAAFETLVFISPTPYKTIKPTLTPSPSVTPSPSFKPEIYSVSLPVDDVHSDDYTTVTLAGDCTLGSQRFAESNPKSFNRVVGNNYHYPFKGAYPLFSDDDLTIINFEGTLTSSADYQEGKKYTFKGPEEYINILTSGSVEMANLANNHSMDYKTGGYNDTVSVMENAAVTPIPLNSVAYYTTADGIKIGVLGLAFPPDSAAVAKQVKQVRNEGADIVLVSVHWGFEGDYFPFSGQKQVAHDAIDAGADLVFGHHPHVLQPVELYKGHYIMYSLGNFSFGGNLNPDDKDTVVFQADFAKNSRGEMKLCEVRAYPFRLSGRDDRNDYRPVPATASQREAILKKLGITG